MSFFMLYLFIFVGNEFIYLFCRKWASRPKQAKYGVKWTKYLYNRSNLDLRQRISQKGVNKCGGSNNVMLHIESREDKTEERHDTTLEHRNAPTFSHAYLLKSVMALTYSVSMLRQIKSILRPNCRLLKGSLT